MKPLAIVPFAFITLPTSGQNLVPNASFEEYDQCPEYLNQLGHAEGWQIFRESPDYFNACDTTDTVGVPTNVFGTALAADGVAYAGVITYGAFPSNTREYLGVELTQQLTPGLPVNISLQVRPGYQGAPFACKWTTKGIGMKFAMTPFVELDDVVPANDAVVYLDEPLIDYAGWTTVSGTYVADSAYSYAIIGNFFDDASSDPVVIDANGSYAYAYAYVDHVCVSYDSSDCDFQTWTHELAGAALLIYPNPFSDHLTISFSPPLEHPVTVELLDQVGRVHSSDILAPGADRLDLTGLDPASGLYTLRTKTTTGAQHLVVLVHVSP